MEEAMEIVTALDGMEIVQSGDGGFAFRSGDGSACCQIASQDGVTVGSMLLQFAPLTSAGQVVAARGEPDYVLGQPFSETEAILMLYYPEQNMLLSVLVPGIQGQLEETSPVVAAVYATSGIFSAAFDSAPMQAWRGYLTYREYVDPNTER